MQRIDEKNNKIYVYTEYNKEFVDICRKLNGQWDRKEKVWIFCNDLKEEIENILTDLFGYKQNKINIFLYIDKENLKQDFFLVGKQIFYRKFRDSYVYIHKDVSILKGELPPSGGSAKYPIIGYVKNMKLLIRNVPENLLHELANYEFEIKENSSKSKYAEFTINQLEEMLIEIKKEIENKK